MCSIKNGFIFLFAFVCSLNISSSSAFEYEDDSRSVSNISGDISWISNPALLGTEEFHWGFRLARIHGSVANNALSLDRYKEYNGEYLTETDKRDIIDAISGDSAKLASLVSIDALSFRWANFGFYTRGYGGGTGGLDKSFIDILFFGNDLNERYSFLNTGSALAYSSIGIALGRPSGTVYDWNVSLGGSLRFIIGLGAADVVESRGETETAIDGIDGWTETTIRYSKGTGTGLAFDFGFWARKDRWEIQLSLNDFGSSVSFGEAEEQYLFYEFEDWTFEDESEEDGHAYVSEDTTLALDSWSCPLPVRLNTLVGYHLNWGHVYLQWLQGLRTFGGGTTNPRISLGTEWRAREWFLPRLQFDVGGTEGISLAAGSGFRIGTAQIDLAITTFAFPPMNSRGIGAALGIGFGS